jgi:hypothetical protein
MSGLKALRVIFYTVVLIASVIFLLILGCALGGSMQGLQSGARGAVALAFLEVALLVLAVRIVRDSLYGSERAKFMLCMPASPARVVRSLTSADPVDLALTAIVGTLVAFGAGFQIAQPFHAACAAVVAAMLHAVALCYGASALALVIGPHRGGLAGPSVRTVAGLVLAAFLISMVAVGEWLWVIDLLAATGAARWFLDHSPWHAPWAAFASTLAGNAAALPWGALAFGVLGLPLMVRVLAPWRVRRMRMEADPPAEPRPATVHATEELPDSPRARRALLLYGLRLEGVGGRMARASLWFAAFGLVLANLLAAAAYAVPNAVMGTLSGWVLVAVLVVLHLTEVDLIGEHATTVKLKIPWFHIHAHALSSWLPIGHLETGLATGVARSIATVPALAFALALCGVLALAERSWAPLVAGILLGIVALIGVCVLGVTDGARGALRPVRDGRLRALPVVASHALLALPVLVALAVHWRCAPFSLPRLVGMTFVALALVFPPACIAVVALRDRIRTLDVDLPRGRDAL